MSGTEYSDITLDGVTYRVWSAFSGDGSPDEQLENVMLRSVESGEEIGKVKDWHEEEIRRIERESLLAMGFSEEETEEALDEYEEQFGLSM